MRRSGASGLFHRQVDNRHVGGGHAEGHACNHRHQSSVSAFVFIKIIVNIFVVIVITGELAVQRRDHMTHLT
jgi:hypothetical protein